MMVGGGAVPATNLTRHDVQRPRPPQVAVMSTPAACAAFRMVVPGLMSRTRGTGQNGQGNGSCGRRIPFFPLDFPRGHCR